MIIIKAIASFIASLSYGVIFNAPKQLLLLCGTAGLTAWSTFTTIHYYYDDTMIASFVGAFAVAIVAHVFARIFKKPMILFNIPGIIPLVPGSIAYRAMRSVVESDYPLAISYASQAFLVSGAVAMGLVFAEVMMQSIGHIIQKIKAVYRLKRSTSSSS